MVHVRNLLAIRPDDPLVGAIVHAGAIQELVISDGPLHRQSHSATAAAGFNSGRPSMHARNDGRNSTATDATPQLNQSHRPSSSNAAAEGVTATIDPAPSSFPFSFSESEAAAGPSRGGDEAAATRASQQPTGESLAGRPRGDRRSGLDGQPQQADTPADVSGGRIDALMGVDAMSDDVEADETDVEVAQKLQLVLGSAVVIEKLTISLLSMHPAAWMQSLPEALCKPTSSHQIAGQGHDDDAQTGTTSGVAGSRSGRVGAGAAAIVPSGAGAATTTGLGRVTRPPRLASTSTTNSSFNTSDSRVIASVPAKSTASTRSLIASLHHLSVTAPHIDTSAGAAMSVVLAVPDSALQHLHITSASAPMHAAHGIMALCEGLRANTNLVHLELDGVDEKDVNDVRRVVVDAVSVNISGPKRILKVIVRGFGQQPHGAAAVPAAAAEWFLPIPTNRTDGSRDTASGQPAAQQQLVS